MYNEENTVCSGDGQPADWEKIKKIYIYINKWYLIKFMTFCMAKKIISKTKRQPTDWRENICNDATNKGSISKTYK